MKMSNAPFTKSLPFIKPLPVTKHFFCEKKLLTFTKPRAYNGKTGQVPQVSYGTMWACSLSIREFIYETSVFANNTNSNSELKLKI